jgi:hypothetical protein
MQQLTQTVKQLFTQIESALHLIANEQYGIKNSLMGNATIGQHVRHIVELYQEMITGYKTGEINYENRQRNFLIETDKTFAIQQMQHLLLQMNQDNKKVLLTAGYTLDDNNCITVETNFAREMIYNIEHTVHHQALIKIAFKSAFDIDLPVEFGVAASTLKYRKACVQ